MKPRKRTGAMARVWVGIAVFVALCGLVLLITGAPTYAPAGADDGPSVEDRINQALGEARRAERALIDANYGEVNRHLRRLDRTLNDLLAELGRD